MEKKNFKFHNGFTLIEMLIVISIIGTLVTLGLASFQTAQASARDGKRKADLERIRSTLEVYRRDCGEYPNSLTFGVNWSANCPSSSGQPLNYDEIPQDPVYPTYQYAYALDSNPRQYTLCAHLERGNSTADPQCQAAGIVSSCGAVCNYSVKAP